MLWRSKALLYCHHCPDWSMINTISIVEFEASVSHRLVWCVLEANIKISKAQGLLEVLEQSKDGAT